MAKRSPKSFAEKLTRMLNGWEELAPAKSFAGMTLAQFRAAVQPSFDARAEIEDLEARRAQAYANRDADDDVSAEKAQQVVNGVLADPTEGPDSALYETFGYTPKRDRKSGLTRGGSKKKTE